MTTPTKKPLPFAVYLNGADPDRGITGEFQSLETAKANAGDRTARAKEIGIAAQYSAQPNHLV